MHLVRWGKAYVIYPVTLDAMLCLRTGVSLEQYVPTGW